MSEQAAFIRAICESPGDDTTRLVFADWLQEHGEEGRAEFIRDAIRNPSYEFVRLVADNPFALLGLKPTGSIPVSGGRGRDNREWMWAATEEFGAMVWDCGRGLWYKPDRGFINLIRCDIASFLRLAEEIFTLHPVARVRLMDKEPEDLGYGWGWFNEPADAAPSSIPDELWHESNRAADDTRWVRADPQDCQRALSLRCVAYGRKLAGLPPLPEPVTA